LTQNLAESDGAHSRGRPVFVGGVRASLWSSLGGASKHDSNRQSIGCRLAEQQKSTAARIASLSLGARFGILSSLQQNGEAR